MLLSEADFNLNMTVKVQDYKAIKIKEEMKEMHFLDNTFQTNNIYLI